VRIETASAELASSLQEEGLALLLLLLPHGGGGVLLSLSHWTRTHLGFVLFARTVGDPFGSVFGRNLLSLRLLVSIHPIY
jgi:hypothetical protein